MEFDKSPNLKYQADVTVILRKKLYKSRKNTYVRIYKILCQTYYFVKETAEIRKNLSCYDCKYRDKHLPFATYRR